MLFQIKSVTLHHQTENNMDRQELINLRNEAYNVGIRWMEEHRNDQTTLKGYINLLLNQFYCGVEPKNELLMCLMAHGIMDKKQLTKNK